jgi:hypothetical protein
MAVLPMKIDLPQYYFAIRSVCSRRWQIILMVFQQNLLRSLSLAGAFLNHRERSVDRWKTEPVTEVAHLSKRQAGLLCYVNLLQQSFPSRDLLRGGFAIFTTT